MSVDVHYEMFPNSISAPQENSNPHIRRAFVYCNLSQMLLWFQKGHDKCHAVLTSNYKEVWRRQERVQLEHLLLLVVKRDINKSEKSQHLNVPE